MDGIRKYLASHLTWYATDAWVHEHLPKSAGWKVQPVEYALAQYREGDGIRRIGPWRQDFEIETE